MVGLYFLSVGSDLAAVWMSLNVCAFHKTKVYKASSQN